MGACLNRNAGAAPEIIVTPQADTAPSGNVLAFVDGNCCPASATIKLALYLKGVHFETFVCEMGCQEDWLKKVSPSGTTPALAWIPKSSRSTSDFSLIPDLHVDPEKSPSTLDMARWLDKTYPQAPMLCIEDEKFQEAVNQVEQLAASIPMIIAAPKPPIQKEKRAVAVAALKKLDALLQSASGKKVLGTEEFTFVDCLLLPWLHRYLLMVHFRSWTPETKPGSVSEEQPPTQAESTLPALASYREAAMQKYDHLLPSKEVLLAFGEKRVKRPSPMSAGRLQHQSFRWWMKDTKVTLQKLQAQPSDQALADRASLAWSAFALFMKEHSVMEDDIIYKEFEQHKPGCTQTSSSEHAHELPLLMQSAEKVKSLAGNSSRTNEDVQSVKEEVDKLCDAFEAHLTGEETHLFPILESLDMKVHYELFPRAFSSCEDSRQSLFAYVLQGLSLSEQEQYWRNIIDYGKLDQDELVRLHGFMRLHLEKGWLTEATVRRLEGRVPELQKIQGQSAAVPNTVN
mmetsp:Transcript_2565/g.6522  ORF Transcript_2565/g.6522 Transcript_2565/m.6522 type:complete len:514 (+) Transcript_2565:79-1620(+)